MYRVRLFDNDKCYWLAKQQHRTGGGLSRWVEHEELAQQYFDLSEAEIEMAANTVTGTGEVVRGDGADMVTVVIFDRQRGLQAARLMPPGTVQKFDDIRDAAQTLNALTDRAGDMVRAVEKHLSDCKVGTSAWVQTKHQHGVRRVYMGYARCVSTMRIVLCLEVAGLREAPDLATALHWSEWPQITRLHTVESLPALLDELRSLSNFNAQDMSKRLDKLQQTLKDLLSLAG